MNKNRQLVKKFYCPAKTRQQALKLDLQNNLIENNVLDESIPLTVFKIQARDIVSHSVVTITCYGTGNVLCMGHGNLFDLTTRLVSFYDKGMPKLKHSPVSKNPICRNTRAPAGASARAKLSRKGEYLKQ